MPRHRRARLGGRALVNRVGHAFFKTRMRDEGAEFGGEVSGHYYFRDFYNADSGTMPALLILELLSRARDDARRAAGRFRATYFISGEINSEVDDQAAKMEEIEARYADAGSPTSTASRSTTTTGTSTCGRRTPSPCCG